MVVMESASLSIFLSTYRSPLLVTISYMALYYVFMIYQMVVKFSVYEKEKKKALASSSSSSSSSSHHIPTFNEVRYNSKDTSLLAADRTVGNCLEQMVPFLMSLWLYSIFISPTEAGTYGIIYVFTRSYYPFVFRMGGIWLLFSTIPNYICIWVMLSKLAWSAW